MSILNDIALLIFRVVISGFMMFGHGLGKFNRLFSGEEIKFFDLFGFGSTFTLSLAVLSEFIAAGLIILGIMTRLSSLTLIVTMGVAAFIFHADDPFGSKEKALMFLTSYVLLFLTGPGKFSLQSLINNRKSYSNSFLKFILG